jgi:hypothetical protein
MVVILHCLGNNDKKKCLCTFSTDTIKKIFSIPIWLDLWMWFCGYGRMTAFNNKIQLWV